MLECEEFFMNKIKGTLADTAAPLTDREESILRTNVLDVREISPAELKSLDQRCVAALRDRFDEEMAVAKELSQLGLPDTRGLSPVDFALEWREHNTNLHTSSTRVISGVVQNWYLSVGRKQELRVSPLGRAGCAPALLLIVAMFAAVGVAATGC